MKKFLLIFGILFGVALSAAAADEFYSSLFMIRFLKCLPTNMSFSTTQGDVTLTQQRQLLNWHDHMCGYNVVENVSDKKTTYSCNLSRTQVTEFATAMRNDPNGVGAAKTYWENLKKDESTCQTRD